VLALFLVLIFNLVAAADPDDEKGPPDLSKLAITDTKPWSSPLMPVFRVAAKKYDVSLPLLLTLGYFGSNFENRGGAPTIEGGYGVMALRDNWLGAKSLRHGASRIHSTAQALKIDPAANIMAAAAVLDSYATDMGIDRSKGLEAWLDPVIAYAGLDEENAKYFASEVFDKLRAGLDYTNAAGERFQFDPQDIGSVNPESLLPPDVVPAWQLQRHVGGAIEASPSLNTSSVGRHGKTALNPLSADYGPAVWDPAASCNYTAVYCAKDTVVCHTIEGSAAGARSWFKNCNSQVSAHYVVSEAGGVWQCVDEDYKAWHVSCYNSRAIGIEHEGYAASSSHPHSLYDASGLLTRDICNSWGIPKEKRTVGPGVLGHIDITRCCCGTHTDPGNGWDWDYYMGVVRGAPPPPAWSATYHAQSYPSSMTAGATAIAWAEFTNQGTGTWNHALTKLGTSSPQDRSSPFYNSANWIGPNRPTEVDQSTVTTGQVGRFTFILKAPTAPGTYVEHYKLVEEGVTWFGPEITWTITVTAATGNITGTVRNSADGQPISGATVAVSGGPSTTTNSSGVYTINGINAATYTITASKTGYNPSSSSVTVNAGQTTTKDFSLTPTDTTPPSAPTGLTATAVSPSQINLSWTAATDNVGVADYRVYRNSVQVGTTAGTTFQDNGLAADTLYSYYVIARDAANNLSPASNTASATTLPGAVPIFEDGFANLNYWEAIVQSPMPGPYLPIVISDKNHNTFAGVNALKSLNSSDPNQGCLIGHTFDPPFGAAKFETYFFDGTDLGYSAEFEGSTEGWLSYTLAYATLTSVGGGVSGSCLQATDGGWTAGCYREVATGFTIGETYSASMWCKWAPPPSGKSYTTAPRFFVEFHDASGGVIRTDYSGNINTDNNWHQYSASGTIPSGTAKIWIGHWGILGATSTHSYYADSMVFTTKVSNGSRQGLQVRCHTPDGGLKAIYYVGCYSAGGPTDSPKNYSVGYYKVCGSGCTGWYWTYNVKARTTGWHKFTLDFLPYTGTGDVKAYIDGTLVATLDRTPDTQTYGLNMVVYGFHYRVNYEAAYDDVAMYATQPYPAPTMGVPQALGATSIRWNFTDNSNNEFGFKAVDAANAIKGTTGVLDGTGSAGFIDEGGLAPNTLYTRTIKAFNGTLDSWNSSPATNWTLSNPPSSGNVTCDHVTGNWSKEPDHQFTAVGGFGVGTVSGYRYAWDQSETHSFTGSEAVWDSGDLLLAASDEGEWYLHVQGYNGEGVTNGTLDLGPFKYDGTPPLNPTSAVETNGAESEVWQSTVSDPSFTWSGASDAMSGVADYLVYFGPDEGGTSETAVTLAAYVPPAVSTGTNYLRACARDEAGNEADEWVTLFTFMYDGSVPDTPAVSDDGPFSGSATKLHATWYSTDADSGVAEYQYAVETSPGAADVVGWTSAGTDGESIITIPDPGLSMGATYFISVKAKNGAEAWSDAGSSDGIQLAEAAASISNAKEREDSGSVGLANKIVTAAFSGSFYIEEADRFSGILVLGPPPAGADPGALVSVGGVMGLNAGNERAILDPAVIVESAADPGRIPPPLFISGRYLGGADFNAYTPGVTGGQGLNQIGLLVSIFGRITSVGEQEIQVKIGLSDEPIDVIASSLDLSGYSADDYVIVTGIASLEVDGSVLKPIIRVSADDGIQEVP